MPAPAREKVGIILNRDGSISDRCMMLDVSATGELLSISTRPVKDARMFVEGATSIVTGRGYAAAFRCCLRFQFQARSLFDPLCRIILQSREDIGEQIRDLREERFSSPIRRGLCDRSVLAATPKMIIMTYKTSVVRRIS
jgi:hypothetical protein